MASTRSAHSILFLRAMRLTVVGLAHTIVLWGRVSVADEKTYLNQVKTVLAERCYACHGALQQQSGLRLDTVDLMRKGGESGSVVEDTKSADGAATNPLLLERILSQEESVRMPPEGEPLKPEQIDAIRIWLASGAPGPADEEPERDPKDHWAFQPPKRPVLPSDAVGATENPIDIFLDQTRAPRGIETVGPVDKRLWLRRVSLDLIGLPPTPEETARFVSDDSQDSYMVVIDRLLNSPQYGERWGRHWMDIWRYSDWWGLGAEVRNSQKHMWHWRDWIIESLQNDKGYDQMIREMIAADELYPNDFNRLRATGFLARQYFRFNRTTWMDETIEHTAKSFVGITLNCAKCHDHKYDPIQQEDYYRFRAIFEPYQVRMEMVPGQVSFDSDAIPRAFDCNLDAKTFLHIRGDERRPDNDRLLQPGIPEILRSRFEYQPTVVQLPREASRPELRSHVLENYLHRASAALDAVEQRIADTEQKLTALRKDLQSSLDAQASSEFQSPTAVSLEIQKLERKWRVLKKEWLWAQSDYLSVPLRHTADQSRAYSGDGSGTQQPSHAITVAAKAERWVEWRKAEWDLELAEQAWMEGSDDKKGELDKKRKEATAKLATCSAALHSPSVSYKALRGADKTPESNVETEESRTKPFPETSTGRRTALAQWLTHREQPLTARVAVNHIWARHFGRPLVPTVFDFGRKGTGPTHPELLDWLAVEFQESGWSMKHIHRLMVSSRAYRMSSSQREAPAASLRIDPENMFYWRMNSVRMESQLVRDSLLHLAEELDWTVGGASIPASEEGSRRRSLYFFHSHNEHERFLSNFDDANVLDCYRRASSIVPQQSLALENSPIVNEMVNKIATKVREATKSDAPDRTFIKAAFERVLSFAPSDQELMLVEGAVQHMNQAMETVPAMERNRAVQIAIVRALINHNDFVTIR